MADAQRDRCAVVDELERVAGDELIRRIPMCDDDSEPAPAISESEGHAGQAGRQAGCEGEHGAVITHPAEAGDRDKPRARKRREMDAVPRVGAEITQVDVRGFAEVVVGQVQMADLGRDDRLDGGRERRVPYGDALVVLEVARLLLEFEILAARIEREDKVGLLDHLARVEREVREVQQQRILIRARGIEVPPAVASETLGLCRHAQFHVERDRHCVGGTAPPNDLVVVDAQLDRVVGMPLPRPPRQSGDCAPPSDW